MTSSALLLIDLINPFRYDRAEELLANTRKIVANVERLAEAARSADVPVVYVNDNFGQWRSSFEETVRACSDGPGSDVVRALEPGDGDYFVLKPQRSGFFATPLRVLLEELGVTRLVMTGIATEMCVLATASDACMRGYEVLVVRDGTASFEVGRRDDALALMEASMGVEIVDAAQVPFKTPARSSG